MKTYIHQTVKNESQAAARSLPKQKSIGASFKFEDKRPQIVAQRKLQNVIQAMSMAGGIVQRNLSTKSSLDGYKIEGNMTSVRQEVGAVIVRNRPNEMLTDINRLRASIASRTAEQATFRDTKTETYQKHAARIADEQMQLQLLQEAYDRELASRPAKDPKPQPDANGWTVA